MCRSNSEIPSKCVVVLLSCSVCGSWCQNKLFWILFENLLFLFEIIFVLSNYFCMFCAFFYYELFLYFRIFIYSFWLIFINIFFAFFVFELFWKNFWKPNLSHSNNDGCHQQTHHSRHQTIIPSHNHNHRITILATEPTQKQSLRRVIAQS